jgi:signal transduction histidine kinase
MRSIQSRLALGLILSLILLFLVQWLVVSVSIRYLTENYIAAHLVQDSETILASLSISSNNDIKLTNSELGLVYSQPLSGQYYKVTVEETEFRSRSLWDTDLSHVEINNENKSQLIVNGPLHQILLQVTSRYTKNSKQIVISVAEDLTNIRKDINTFQIRFSIVTLLIVIILIAVQAYIVNKNLKPLDTIRRELKSLDEGLISQLDENVPLEVLPLVRELNQQLTALRQRLDRSRNATGNLAHALKTPLSLLYQLVDDPVLNNHIEYKEILLQSAKSIDESIKRELKRARIAGKQYSARHSKLEPEIKSLLETLTRIYQDKDLNIHYKLPKDISCNMDRQDLMEMLGNVLDNACKWAQQEVLITIEKTTELINAGNTKNTEHIVFIIEDDGAGCSIEEMENLTQRGNRLDEKTTGHGLGLSIVQSIIEDYRGELSILSSEKLGGLRITISIPVF